MDPVQKIVLTPEQRREHLEPLLELGEGPLRIVAFKIGSTEFQLMRTSPSSDGVLLTCYEEAVGKSTFSFSHNYEHVTTNDNGVTPSIRNPDAVAKLLQPRYRVGRSEIPHLNSASINRLRESLGEA